MDPRHVSEPTSIGYTDAQGNQVEITSRTLKDDDTYHYLPIDDPAAAAVADALDLPVARRAVAEAPRPSGRRRTSRRTTSNATPSSETTVAEPATQDGGDQ